MGPTYEYGGNQYHIDIDNTDMEIQKYSQEKGRLYLSIDHGNISVKYVKPEEIKNLSFLDRIQAFFQCGRWNFKEVTKFLSNETVLRNINAEVLGIASQTIDNSIESWNKTHIFNKIIVQTDKGSIASLSIQQSLKNVVYTPNDEIPIKKAIQKGNLVAVRAMMQERTPVVTKELSPFSLLKLAIEEDKLAILKYLLDEKFVDINDLGENNETPLMIACKKGNREIVKFLLDNRAAYWFKNSTERNALMMACERGNKEIAQLFVEKEAQVNSATQKGWTPLMLACNSYESENSELVELLLKHGAHRDSHTTDGWTPFMIACSRGHKKIVELLLENGAKFDTENADGNTPLLIACGLGHTDIVKILLNKGAFPDALNDNNQTPLMLACSNGEVEIVKALLEKDLEIDQQDKSGWNALHRACAQGHLEVVKLLIEKKPQMAAGTSAASTPLHLACQNQHLQIVEFLLNNGAFANYKNRNGKTPLDIAIAKNNTELQTILQKYNAKKGDVLLY